MLRRFLLAPPALRTALVPIPPRALPPLARPYSAAPNIAQTSFWISLIPKPFRKSSPTAALKKKVKSKEWNPATFFIAIFLLIGSMSIQMIALRNDFAAFSRRADARIGLLKEIIERIQNGEDVDVEGLLGTGDAVREKEWEEVLQEIEREDQAWEESRKSKPKHGRNLEEANTASKPQVPTPKEPPAEKPKSNAPSGFY
ncbi:hypothetical protein ONS95_009477 [Cadophora gregata]|uniref:uncharacterized protein n=1 Tax=Cadophora gregata TaxID=51156 RepID=UPI0026DBC588|nr:uncharacterized protein ONS95_009477 [Cadophora gregata]KAK0124528.1 hypothetical protein ONS95_009477 [Cadophora gregata]KAK0129620.1 hypothetical protein ONS96_000184 [Cadophora gregata f. sp. sojae]